MKRQKMGFIPFFFCFMITVIDSSRFNLDYTDGVSEASSKNFFRHTCLHAATAPSVYSMNNARQIIYYCLSEWQSEWNMKKNNRDQRFSFTELRKQNITSRQLYMWSAPMDLIERYQFFLNNPTILNEIETDDYYNCSFPWFGPMCEYTFDQYESNNLSFADIIHSFYTSANTFDMLTCYEHLQCDHVEFLSCLDWSEICDGNIDCPNGGRDEEHCWQLEINECQNNEFRCLNGQCIDGTFYHDDRDNPDCSDGTDEPFESLKDALCGNTEPTLFCEDITCVIHRDLDGMQSIFPCGLERKKLKEKAMLSIKENSTHETCWSALNCLAKTQLSADNIPCRKLCRNPDCEQLIEEYCPPLIYLPFVPVLFNHVYLVYMNNQTIYLSPAMPPAYVCYNQHLCPELPTTTTLPSLNNTTCRPYSEIPSFGRSSIRVDHFSRYIDRLYTVFWACRSIINTYNSSALCNAPSMYQCVNTTKCISIYRINNGIRDCFYGDDEQQIMTTEQIKTLKPSKNWYQCETLNMSIASHLLDSRLPVCYCTGNCDDEISDDDRYIQNHISFQTICDGFVELRLITIDSKNETDETECEQWQCNNIYTHCDGIWNCNNGADELDCNQSPLLNCESNEHVCVSPSTYQFMCLPLNQSSDGIADCLGGTDEPQLCQRNGLDYFQHSRPFFCAGESLTCLGIEYLCWEGLGACDNGDQLKFCTTSQTKMKLTALCDDGNALFRSDVENYFCDSLSFSKKKTVYFSLDEPTKSNNLVNPIETKTSLIQSPLKFSEEISSQQNYCYRGLNVRVLLDSDKNITTNACLCPPSYYGTMCQYQNQRVSLTLKLRTVSDSWNISFAVFVSLVDDNDQTINLIEQVKQFTYLFVLDCQNKFHLSLLYSTRPKHSKKNYSIHINVYEKQSLTYRSSWAIPILFSFLPVHRITNLLTIPSRDDSSKSCSDSQCVNGQCTRFDDNKMNKTFCRCNQGWSGRFCNISYRCTCSNDSFCIGITANNRSLCVCPLNKFGSRCLLDESACQNAPCKNGGYCVSIDENMSSENKFKCICPDGFHGDKCETKNTEIVISFQKDINLPQSMLVHLIQVYGDAIPKRTTKYKKIPLSRDLIIIHSSDSFHILIVEFQINNYYLGIIPKSLNTSTTIKTTIDPSHRCPHIRELFNETFIKHHLLRRIKYYHLPCQNNSSHLSCFFDDVHICSCTDHGHQRVANCLEFDHHMQSDCLGQSVCENKAACYYDNSICPQASICQCPGCFYGTRCEFNTKGFGLSLDAILGYYIQPYTSLLRQPSVIQVSATFTMIMFVMGIINSILCIITFKVKKLHEIGCGLYLICLSITSLVTMTIFALKFWLLVLSQMALITNRSFLNVQCIFMDFILRIGLSMDQWLSVCVAIERTITVVQGVNFNKSKSKKAAKWVILAVVVFITSSVIQEAIQRRLIDDKDGDEQRIWCIITYSQGLQIFNSIVHIFHVAVPCLINLISAFFIIRVVAQQRAIVHTHQTYKKHLREQFQKHRHLLIAPCVLIILAIPRLVLAFISGCMKSARSPWLFLVGYFISFIPPLVTFIIFVLPSETYKKEFIKSYEQYRKTIQRCMSRNS